MKSPRKLLVAVLAGVVVIAGVGWALGARLRSPADEAARRAAPRPSLVTVAVERRRLVSAVVVSGTVEYGSPLPVSLAGAVGGGEELQRATRAPRKGRLVEGAVLMEVNGRPVFALRGAVPMHRTITPGAEGADVGQLQRALRRLGYGGPRTGVFDQATIAAVARMYAAKGYEAQKPALADRQTYDTLRQAVRTARETLATERQALDRGRDVSPLKLRAANAEADLAAAKKALEQAGSRRLTSEDETRLAAADEAARTAREKLAEARRALAAAGDQPTAAPSDGPRATAPAVDRELLEMRVANAEAELAAAGEARSRILAEAAQGRETRLTELRKAVRDAREALATAEQALRQARQLAPARLKVANARKNVAAAEAMLAEFARTYGTSVPPGEVVFLPKLPARVHKSEVKPGQRVEAEVATVTSSVFMVTGTVEAAESGLLRAGMRAEIEPGTGRKLPATLTAVGERAAVGSESAGPAADGGRPVLLTPASMKGLKAGTAVTTRITVGATEEPVLVVPIAAVITGADGRTRVRVEYAPDRTRDVEVRTGLAADGNVEVTGELKEGDRVVVSDV
ncbi:peptidoglycan-binding protein [Nonomuraea sp. C10]|uniref:peptidoglycan-binding protein n=1 Tax=Nonomuraea sp. C10 TaxID=2600577 RepID=UPI0011CE80D5|nr:peptidoglycan-binding protein [Nonomuraea sp. C10]TXK34845.1 peptidoglycan-binding protein [Nonomuraea sp. C10]